MENKIVNIWLSVRPSKRHPILIYKLQSGKRITVTLFTLSNDNEQDVAVAQEIYDRKRRQLALDLLDAATELNAFRNQMALGEFERKFLAHRRQLVKLGDISALSVDEDIKAFKALKRQMGSAVQLADLTGDFVKQFVHKLRTTTTNRHKPYSNFTINKFLRTLSAAFNYAVEQNYVAKNHFAAFGKLKTANPKENIRDLQAHEVDAYRRYFSQLPFAKWQLHAYLFALNTLCRAGSIVRVKYSDIYAKKIDGKTVQFVHLVEKRDTHRDVPLFGEAIHAIDAMRRLAASPDDVLQSMQRKKTLDDYKRRIDAGYIFFPVSSIETLSKMMNRATKQLLRQNAISSKATFHNLRDTGATYLLENGVGIETVSYMLGHSNIRTTQNHYAKLTSTMAARQVSHLSGVHADTNISRDAAK